MNTNDITYPFLIGLIPITLMSYTSHIKCNSSLEEYNDPIYKTKKTDYKTPPDLYLGDTQSEIMPIEHNNESVILKDFISHITENSKEMDPEFSKFIDDNFWDLV